MQFYFISGVVLAVMLVVVVRMVWHVWLQAEEDAHQRERMRQMANGGDAQMIPWARFQEAQRARQR